MKKLLVLSAITLFLGLSTVKAQTNIVVAIAKKKTCAYTDLGYQVYYGSSKPYELRKQAIAKVKQNVSSWESVETKDNEDWGKHMGNHLIIILGSSTDSSGCTRKTYGVGFGTSRNAALANAKKHLTSRNWSWSEKKHSFSVEVDKLY